MRGESPESSGGSGGATSRREFLHCCAAAAIAFVGATAVLTPSRSSRASAPKWRTVPNQSWAIGVPVHLDLAEYCSDADGDPLTFELTRPLPPGLTLQGSVISGTPTAPVPPTIFVAVASDGSQESRVPAASLRVSPNPGRGPVRITIRRRSDVGRYARLRVTNIAGATVYEQELWLGAATDEFEWNGAAKDGSRLASGAYIVSVLADSETVHTRFTLVR